MGEQWSSESHFKHTVRGWIPSDLKEEGQTSHRDVTPWAPSPGGSLGIVHTSFCEKTHICRFCTTPFRDTMMYVLQGDNGPALSSVSPAP